MTPGYTTQALWFTANLYKFDNLKATVIGVSPDDSAKHRKFIEKYDLAITLLADEDKKWLKIMVFGSQKSLWKEFIGVKLGTTNDNNNNNNGVMDRSKEHCNNLG